MGILLEAAVATGGIIGETNKPDYIQIPATWGGQPINKGELSHFGYDTYRLQLRVPLADIGKPKAVYLNSIGSAYRIWIDGIEQEGLGRVGTKLSQEMPKSRINLIFFQPMQETEELLIQVSNYSFRVGGIFTDITYGDAAALSNVHLKNLLDDTLIIGGFCIIGFYHLVIYGIRRTERSILRVGLFALLYILCWN